jgi:hypothetical protein
MNGMLFTKRIGIKLKFRVEGLVHDISICGLAPSNDSTSLYNNHQGEQGPHLNFVTDITTIQVPSVYFAYLFR